MAVETRPHRNRRPQVIGCVVLVVAAAAITFSPVWGHQFLHWDDRANTIENPWLNPPTPSKVWRFWREPYFGLYVPLTYTLFAFEACLAKLPDSTPIVWSMSPRPFHAGNFVLHLLSAVAVFCILLRLVERPAAACCGALVFALHPIQTEGVAWITETKGLLAAALSFFAIWRYLAFASPHGPLRSSPTAAWRFANYLVATVLFALALVAKPSAVAVPLVVMLLDCGWIGRRFLQCALAVAPWWLMAIAITFVNKTQQAGELIVYPTRLWEKPLVAADALAFYLYKLAVPVWLGPDYGRSPRAALAAGWPYYTWLVPLAVLIAAAIVKPSIKHLVPPRSPALVALGIFVAGMLPVSGLVDFGFQNISTVADRYVYLSMLGPALVVAWWASRCRAVTIGVIVAVLLLLGIPSYLQARRWHNDETIFHHALEVNPNSSLAMNNLGLAYFEKGDFAAAESQFRRAIEVDPQASMAYYNLGSIYYQQGRLEESRERFAKAVHVDPHYANAHNYLATVLRDMRRRDEARYHYGQALRAHPQFRQAYFNLGTLELSEGNAAKAVEHFQRAIQLEPNYGIAHNSLAKALSSLGRIEEAIHHGQEAVRITPKSANAHNNLALLLARQCRYADAIRHYRQAQRLQPNLMPVMVGLAWVLVTADDPRLRDGDEGLRLAQEASLSANNQNATALDVLAAAYAENGQFDDALRIARRGLEQSQAAQVPALVELFQRRIRLYESRQPLRGETLLAQ